MYIGNNSIFMGAYAERMQDKISHADFRTQANEAKQQEVTWKAAEALKEIKRHRDADSVSVSISKEGRELLCGAAGYEKRKADTEEFMNGLFTGYTQQQEKLQQNNPDDPFWGSTGNQWLVFSKKLYDSGFYDNMTDEEVKQMENILDKITGGMDGFGRVQHGAGLNIDAYMEAGGSSGSGFHFLTESKELWTELESSTAALKYFAEKYIQDDELKAEINGLAQQYYMHNSEQLDGYQSLSEKMKQFTNDVFSGKYPDSALLHKYAQPLLERNAGNVNTAQYLGSIIHNEEEMKQYRSQIALLFQQLSQGTSGWEDAWKKMKSSFVDFATKGSNSRSIRDSVAAQADTTFERMKGYWSLLV